MTKIEWTEKTWNPVTGCTKVSPGCDHCYAEGIARRFAGSKAFPNGFDVTLHPERLDAPLRWRKPSRVFVNSMSDLFHADVPDEFIARVFAVMADASQHTFQVLTKRHGRMRSLLNDGEFFQEVRGLAIDAHGMAGIPWPLPNVWLGTSVEDQKRADLRIPALLDTPAAVRFLSCEPLLGPVNLDRYLLSCGCGDNYGAGCCRECMQPPPYGSGLHWVIVGGESGPGARPMELEWAQSLVWQCSGMDVAVFVKQLGSAHGPGKGGDIDTWPAELQVREYPTAVNA